MHTSHLPMCPIHLSSTDFITLHIRGSICVEFTQIEYWKRFLLIIIAGLWSWVWMQDLLNTR